MEFKEVRQFSHSIKSAPAAPRRLWPDAQSRYGGYQYVARLRPHTCFAGLLPLPLPLTLPPRGGIMGRGTGGGWGPHNKDLNKLSLKVGAGVQWVINHTSRGCDDSPASQGCCRCCFPLQEEELWVGALGWGPPQQRSE